MFASLNGDISMCISAEVLNGRVSRAIEVIRSTLNGLPEGEGGVSTFQVVTVLTEVEEALLGMSDAPDTSKSGAIEPHQGPRIAVTTQPQPDAETVAPSIPASDVESTIEEKRPADKLRGGHRSQTLAELCGRRPRNSTPRERRPPKLHANHQRTTLSRTLLNEFGLPSEPRGFRSAAGAEASPSTVHMIRKASPPISLWSPSPLAALPNR